MKALEEGSTEELAELFISSGHFFVISNYFGSKVIQLQQENDRYSYVYFVRNHLFGNLQSIVRQPNLQQANSVLLWWRRRIQWLILHMIAVNSGLTLHYFTVQCVHTLEITRPPLLPYYLEWTMRKIGARRMCNLPQRVQDRSMIWR